MEIPLGSRKALLPSLRTYEKVPLKMSSAEAIAATPLYLWNHWETQILVLLSLALQVVLVLLASIRRRKASAVLRILLWLAYQLADSTAIYTIGHLSLGATLQGHQLVAFWAPFLLLHLGGPDNITAYALQDNELWLRHLLTLVVQVLGAAYVLYKHVRDDSLVALAAILMFIVGVVKYAERTWALKCGNLDRIRSSLKVPLSRHPHLDPMDQGLVDKAGEESCARRAHSLFHVCKHAIVDSWVEKDAKNQSVQMLRELRDVKSKDMWMLMEMELSLLYDLLYTKAGVIHTWSGYCIRAISPLVVTASLLLFQFSGKGGHSRVDIAVTYTLLAGAFLLETGSLLSALGSTWTYAFLCATRWSWLYYTALCRGRWDRLRCFVKKITGRSVNRGSARRWSGKMGQYNMLHFCSHHDRAFKPLLGRLARMLGYDEWWIRYYYSGTIDIPGDLKEELFDYVKVLTPGNGNRDRQLNAQGVIRKMWGQTALKEKDEVLYRFFKENNLFGVEFQEGIIIWHIGTDIFLAESSRAKADDAAFLVKAIRTLSNYIMFLLVGHPYMLPGLAQSTLYLRTRGNLVQVWEKAEKHNLPKGHIYTKFKELFSLHDDPNFSGFMNRDQLASILYKEKPPYSDDKPRLSYANNVAERLLKRDEEKGPPTLNLLLNVWMDFLVYAANRCSRVSHADMLSNGGELTTILWLMTNYLHQEDYAVKREEASIMPEDHD